MPTAAFTTLGCKVNQYETQKILESFEAAGFSVVPFEGPADVYVINTCSVTSQAESKSRYTIRRATRHNPSARVVVTGCASQMASNKGEAVDGADVVVPNPEKLDALRYLLDSFPELGASVLRPCGVAVLRGDFGESTNRGIGESKGRGNGETEKRRGGGPDGIAALRHNGVAALGGAPHRTRATLKVQDGCSVFCSYCSIPFTRPVMTSRPYSEVLDEAVRMAGMGYREVILTGVLIGAYGPETGSGGPVFEDLVEGLARELGSEVRIRISSIEMRQVTPRLVSLIRDGLVVPHLHIPLQAGDTGVLRDMNRPYTQDDYFSLCSSLYESVPDMSITTDIMVGFPTESEERFLSSVHVCETVRYLKAHLFRFSPRFGTPADQWGDPVSPVEKQRRSAVLSGICARTGAAHVRRFVGRTMRVLVEGKIGKDGLLQGLTDNYIEVKFAGSPSLARSFAWVRLDEERDGVAYGELAGEPSGLALRVVG